MSRRIGTSELTELIKKAAPSLDSETLDCLVRQLYPVFEPVDFEGKSLFIKVNSSPHSPDVLDRFYAYADLLRNMGAKNVVFLPMEAEVSVHELDLKKMVKVVFRDGLPPADQLEKYRDWFRIAGCDPNKVAFVADGDIEIGEENGNY